MTGFVLLLGLALLAVVTHGVTTEEKQRATTGHEECQEDPNTYVDRIVLKQYFTGEHLDKSKVGAHVLCMSKKLRFQKQNGKVDKEEIEKHIAGDIQDDTKLKEAVNRCAIDKDDEIETALALLKCFPI